MDNKFLVDTYIIDFINENKIPKILKESTTQLNGAESDDGPATFYTNTAQYKKGVKKNLTNLGWDIISYIIPNNDKTFADNGYAEAFPVTYFEAGNEGTVTPNNSVNYTTNPAFKHWKARIDKIAEVLGQEFVNFSNEKETIKQMHESIDFSDSFRDSLMKEKRRVKFKLKDLEKDYIIKKLYIKWKNNNKISIDFTDLEELKKAYKMLVGGVKMYSSTNIHLKNYDADKKTIKFNDIEIKLSVLDNLIRLATHYNNQ